MRTGLFALLALLLVVSSSPWVPIRSEGQSISVGESGNNLLLAYQAVQRADSLGASSDKVAALSSQLNTALAYYNDAVEFSSEGNLTEAQRYSALSNNTSSAVLAQALVLQQQAQTDKTSQQVLAYVTAIAGSVLSALFILEYHRIPNFVRKRKLLKTRISPVDQDEPKN